MKKVRPAFPPAASWVLWWLLLLQCGNSLSSQLCPHLPAPYLLAFFKVRHASYSVRRDRGSRACLPWNVWSNPANYARLKTWTRKERLWMLMTLRSLIAQMMKLCRTTLSPVHRKLFILGVLLLPGIENYFNVCYECTRLVRKLFGDVITRIQNRKILQRFLEWLSFSGPSMRSPCTFPPCVSLKVFLFAFLNVGRHHQTL